MDGVAVKPLTVGFHEGHFLGTLNQENRADFWFQLNRDQRQQLGSPMGPVNAQALNRYSYVQNNPLKYTDPSGHVKYSIRDPDLLDLWTDTFELNAGYLTDTVDIVGVGIGVAIGTAFTGPGAAVAGVATAVGFIIWARQVERQVGAVKQLFGRAKVAADDDDRFEIEIKHGRVRILVYDEQGRIKFDRSVSVLGAIEEELRKAAQEEGIRAQ